MKKKYADYLIKLAFLTLAIFFVFDFSVVSGWTSKLFSVCKPVFFGVLFFMILSVPFDIFSGIVFKKIKKEKIKKALAYICTALLVGGALTLLVLLILPQSIESVKEIAATFSSPASRGELAKQNPLMAALVAFGQKVYEHVATRFSEYFPALLDRVSDIFTGAYNVLFGAFIGLLLLACRDGVKRQFIHTVLLVLPETKAHKIFSFLRRVIKKFSRYLGGQVTEAFILGTACYLVMLLLRVPYPALIGFVIGFSNLIPVVGAYIGGAICGVLIFAVNPIKCLVFTVAVFVLQQIEAFTTYPIVVGKYVGLSGFWIAVSVPVWGGLFGFWGLFLGVPLTAVIQDLLRAEFLRRKKLPEKV
ncbi:MAG: AI-2E family transporter [Clostridia bacterium]|nr:AI-2E family transporter [Clostridia bacterium]